RDSERPQLRQILAEESTKKLAEHVEIKAGIRSALDTADVLASRALADLTQFSSCPDRSLLETIASFAVCRDA
ncbi:MAG: hypothetical protein P8J37_10860, partial [Fuerstiella sp.]|nr:hypothetical protein [Fuerstiella sp.]